ncbi:hypothetical protein [Paraburkholderia sp. RL17-337-BIB-A]|uniref:hypothetical protein n=1 Tax=Paraburkholderia sp. RL17-337-BIB-A TaxID=3031636 RepID=UPI0038B8F01D
MFVLHSVLPAFKEFTINAANQLNDNFSRMWLISGQQTAFAARFPATLRVVFFQRPYYFQKIYVPE